MPNRELENLRSTTMNLLQNYEAYSKAQYKRWLLPNGAY